MNRFVKQENLRFKQFVALEQTVSGSAVFSVVAQLYQGVHQDFLAVKSQDPQLFRLLSRATVSAATRGEPLRQPPAAAATGEAHGTRPAGHRVTAELGGVDGLLISLELLLFAMQNPLSTIAATTNPGADFCASRTTLHHSSALIDLCQALFGALEPLADPYVASSFVDVFNQTVLKFNAAVMTTNAIVASHPITTH